MGGLSMALYIDTAYHMIINEGADAVSIRKIAKELNVSSTSLYKHFDNLDHLMKFAYLRFMRPYIRELAEMGEAITCMDDYIKIWRCFAKHSFNEPYIYNQIFFANQQYDLAAIIREYYSIFEEDLFRTDSTVQQFLQEGVFAERDMLTLRAAATGMNLTESQLTDISTLTVYLYKGMMKELLDGCEYPDHCVERFEHYLNIIIYGVLDRK